VVSGQFSVLSGQWSVLSSQWSVAERERERHWLARNHQFSLSFSTCCFWASFFPQTRLFAQKQKQRQREASFRAFVHWPSSPFYFFIFSLFTSLSLSPKLSSSLAHLPPSTFPPFSLHLPPAVCLARAALCLWPRPKVRLQSANNGQITSRQKEKQKRSPGRQRTSFWAPERSSKRRQRKAAEGSRRQKRAAKSRRDK